MAVPLPSIRRHALAAVCLVIAVVTGLAALGTSGPAPLAGGTIALPAMPLPAAADTLMAAEGGTLPDLLAGEIAEGVNPTEAIRRAETRDVLGNPVQAGAKIIRIPPSGLGPSPLPGLTRDTPDGLVPAIAPDGRRASTAYARPATVKGPSVAVLLGGLGINPEQTERAISDLPPEITLAFAAHAPGLQDWIDRARAAGHEAVLELPLETANPSPLDPTAQLTLRAGEDNADRLQALLAKAHGYAGVANYNGDAFLTRADASATLAQVLSGAGLALVFDAGFEAPSLPVIARAADLPLARGTFIVDEVPDVTLTTANLDRLTAQASTTPPIGVAFGYPQTIDALQAWADDLSGVDLVPVSATWN